MSFMHPEFLYLMLPPLFILFGLLLTQRESQENFFSEEVMDKLRVSANTLTLKARNALFLLMGIFIIIALAEPVIKDGTIEVKAKSADVMIALDISDSMLAEDVYPNRLKLAKEKAMELLKIAPNERIGVVAFAKNSYLVSPMSFDHSAVGFLLRQLNTDSITEKGTDFLSLLEVVDKSIKNDSKKYLLVLSDGGDSEDFSKEIEYAKEKNIVVFILALGTQKGAPIRLKDGAFIKHKGEIIVSKVNEEISKLATSSGGVYIQSVKSDEDIKTMLKEIERLSQKRELKSEKIQKYIPLFYYPLGMALILLLIATSSMSKRERVNLPSAFLLFALFFINPDSKAGVLDFVELKEAKEAYESGDYERSAKLYSKHAKMTNNAHSYFNEANALYKQKKYPEAIESYNKALFDDEIQRANNYANIGNSYVKNSPQDLQKALEAYEKSLELNEDKEVRENLEAVKKALEKQQEEKDKEKQEEEEQKDKDKKDEEQEDKQEKEKKSEDDKESKDSEDSKESDEKKESSEDKESSKNEDAKNEDSKQMMSDEEEQKWLKELNSGQSTYMYMLNNNKQKERDSDEKPW